MCLDSGHVSSGIFHVSTYDKRLIAIIEMVCSWNGCLDTILKHCHDCVKVGGNFAFDVWPNDTLSIKFSDCEKLTAFLQLPYDRLFTCTHTECVGRAYRHQQTHKDSCISISNPDDPLVVGDMVTHRRSYHPGTVVDCTPGSRRVAVHFEGQDDGCSRQINRRECRKRPRVRAFLVAASTSAHLVYTREAGGVTQHTGSSHPWRSIPKGLCMHV